MQTIELENNIWMLKGPITFDKIPTLIKLINNYQWKNSMIVDLSRVEDVDTSLLGILFEWKRQAKKNGYFLNIKSPPENLIKLAKLYGVEEFIIKSH